VWVMRVNYRLSKLCIADVVNSVWNSRVLYTFHMLAYSRIIVESTLCNVHCACLSAFNAHRDTRLTIKGIFEFLAFKLINAPLMLPSVLAY